MGVEIVVQNFINGEFHESERFLDSYDPSTGNVWAKVPDSGPDDVEQAVQAAKAAFPIWSNMTLQERSKILCKLADLIDANLEDFARAESQDQGKPISLARMMDIPRAALNFRHFAQAMLHHTNKSHLLDSAGTLNYSTQMPVGVAGLISPWNLPIYLLTFKIGPALACGNTIVCKPSEMTSVTAWMLCKLTKEAGLPDGVLNMVFGTGEGVGKHLVAHPDVPLISFTGSTATGERIRQMSVNYTKKLSLEMGGKNPALVFADCDLETTLQTTVRASYANQGEICLATSRIYVQREIYDKYVTSFVERARKIKVGDPLAPDTQMGALVSKEHLEKVRSYLEIAKKEGCSILCGETVDKLKLPEEKSKGYFFLPTVVTNVSDSSRVMQEEIFGPMVCIVPFDTEEEGIARANSSIYGLSATVYTKDVGRANRVALKLQAGTVWVNCWLVRDLSMPFGGMKESGIGREGTEESIEFYTETKTVCLKL